MGRGFSRTVSRWSRLPDCCGFRGVFWVGWIFSCFFFSDFFFFFERTRPTSSTRPPVASFTSLLVVRNGSDRRSVRQRGRACSKRPFCTPRVVLFLDFSFTAVRTQVAFTFQFINPWLSFVSWITQQPSGHTVVTSVFPFSPPPPVPVRHRYTLVIAFLFAGRSFFLFFSR